MNRLLTNKAVNSRKITNEDLVKINQYNAYKESVNKVDMLEKKNRRTYDD
jgi:hypothetical protein